MRKIYFLLLILIVGIFISLQFINAQTSKKDITGVPDEILLKSRQFAPEAGLSIYQNGKNHFLIQLDNFPTEEERKNLENKGIKFLGYIPNKAWIVSLSRISPETAVEFPNVRFIGDIFPEDKISPNIKLDGVGEWAKDEKGNVYLDVKFYKDISLDFAEKVIKKYKGEVMGRIDTINYLTISLPKEDLIDSLANEDVVQWIDAIPLPSVQELVKSRVRIGASVVQAAPYNLTGNGTSVFIYDAPAYYHEDLVPRLTNIYEATADSHATHCAGIIGGNGSINSSYKGIAPQALLITDRTPPLTFDDYNDTTGMLADYNYSMKNHNTTIASNSWGQAVSGESCNYIGDYEAQSELFDDIVTGSLGRYEIIVFSAGNNREDVVCGDAPYEIYDNYHIINPPHAAKNIITVGATNSNEDSMTFFSNWGPTEDGRIKPDVVAPGCNNIFSRDGSKSNADESIWSTWSNGSYYGSCGTSMAAPHVAGAAALMLQQYNITYGNRSILPSTIKALLIHTADDVNNTGPDFTTGWGRINVSSAVDIIRSKNLTEERILSIGETDRYNLTINGGDQFIKVTIVWDDEPALPQANKTLINDLNLILISPNGTEYYPWMLNPVDPRLMAKSGMDHLNNVEQVYVANPENGKWVIQLNASALNSKQNYSLIASKKFTFYNNTPPSMPKNIICNGGSCDNSFYKTVGINCSGGIDNESDAVTYFIDANYSYNSTNFSISLFNNSWGTETLSFNGNENITRYLPIPKEANVTSAKIRLTGPMSGSFISLKVYPEEDTEVNQEEPNLAHGANETLNASYMSYMKYVLMKFALTDIANGTAISYGELVIHINNSDATWFNVQRFNNISWDEDVMTWNMMDQEDLGTFINNTALSAGNNDQTINVGLTSYIQQKVNQKTSIYINPSSSRSVTVTSKEGVYEPYLNITYYNLSSPKNPYLEVGIPGEYHEWNYTDLFNTSQVTSDLSSAINNYLVTCTPVDGICYVPVLFHSDIKSKLQYSELNITYQLNKFWQNIGNHTQSSVFNWNISIPPMTNQSGINLRCRARDIQGSNTYSQYYSPVVNLTISSAEISTGKLEVTEINLLNTTATKEFLEFKVKNSQSNELSGINWSFNNGESIIYASNLINLSSMEAVFVYVEYNYSSLANRLINASVLNQSGIIHSNITRIAYLNVSNLDLLNSSLTKRIFGFSIKNSYSSNLNNVYWNLTLGDGNSANSAQNTILLPYEQVLVIAEYTYTMVGPFIVNASATNYTLVDSKNLTVAV